MALLEDCGPAAAPILEPPTGAIGLAAAAADIAACCCCANCAENGAKLNGKGNLLATDTPPIGRRMALQRPSSSRCIGVRGCSHCRCHCHHHLLLLLLLLLLRDRR